MGLWFLLNVLMFLGGGLWLLYAQIAGKSVPLSILGAYLTITAVGLLMRQRWARATAAALWISALPGTFVFLYGKWPTEQFAFAAIVVLILTLKSLKDFLSASMDEVFGAGRPALWLIALLALPPAAILIHSRGNTFALATVSLPGTTAKAVARGGAPGEAKPPTEEVRAQAEKAMQGRGVRACKISLDETRLLLVTSDGYGHIVDLRSGHFTSYASKIETRDWPESFKVAGANPIGPDADMYFDSDRNMILRFSDSSFRYGIGGGSNQFASFTSSPNQIIVFNRDTRLLRRIEIPIGTVIWSLKLSEDSKNIHFPSYTSPDYTWMTVSFGKNRLSLIRMREGRLFEITPDYEHLLGVQFGARWVRTAGLYAKAVNNYVFNLPDVRLNADIKLPPERIVAYDLEREVYVTRDGPAKVVSAKDGDYELLGSVLGAGILNPNRFVVAMEEGQSQLTLIDLEAKSVTPVGRRHELKFSHDQSCFTVSSTRRLFAGALGDKVEVFWSDFLTPDKFRSVVLTLPVK